MMPAGCSYVASLIDVVYVKMVCELNIEADDVDYEYTYRIKSEMRIVDDKTGAVIYNPTKTLKPQVQVYEKAGNPLKIDDYVTVSYDEYNNMEREFLSVYSLSDVTCTRFFIPTNTRILYLYEVKVDNYDAIYNI